MTDTIVYENGSLDIEKYFTLNSYEYIIKNANIVW